jgi:hypothetical protein
MFACNLADHIFDQHSFYLTFSFTKRLKLKDQIKNVELNQTWTILDIKKKVRFGCNIFLLDFTHKNKTKVIVKYLMQYKNKIKLIIFTLKVKL